MRQRQRLRHAATCSATAATSATTPSTCRLRRAATTARRAASTSRTRSSSATTSASVVGARVDKFAYIDDAGLLAAHGAHLQAVAGSDGARVVQPRVPRAVAHQQLPRRRRIVNQVNLGAINPAFAPAGGPLQLPGERRRQPGPDARSRSTPYEIGLHRRHQQARDGVARRSTTTRPRTTIFFTQTGRYRAPNPPPGGWPSAGAAAGRATALGVLEVLPPPCAGADGAVHSGGLPSDFSYRNLGTVQEQGHRARRRRRRQPRRSTSSPTTRTRRAGSRLRHLGSEPAAEQPLQRRVQLQPGPLPGQHVASATWTRRTGRTCSTRASTARPTAYTQVNGAFGVKWAKDKVTTTHQGRSTCSTRRSSRTSSATSSSGR